MLNYDPEPFGTLVVIFGKARNLPNRRTLGKQNPYCIARVGQTALRCPADIRGGQSPVWDHEVRFELMDVPDQKYLKLSVLDETNNKPELVGDIVIQLAPAFENKPDVGYDDWHELLYRDKYAGEVYLEVTFYPAKPPLPKKPVDILEFRHSLLTRPESVMSLNSTMTGARALPPYPNDQRVGTPIQPIIQTMPDIPIRTDSTATHRHSHSPLPPVPGTFTHNEEYRSDDDDYEDYERHFYDSSNQQPLTDLPPKISHKRHSLPPLPPSHMYRTNDSIVNDFSNLNISRGLPVIPGSPIEPEVQPTFSNMVPLVKNNRHSINLPSIPARQNSWTQPPQNSVHLHHQFEQPAPPPQSLTERKSLPQLGQYPQPIQVHVQSPQPQPQLQLQSPPKPLQQPNLRIQPPINLPDINNNRLHSTPPPLSNIPPVPASKSEVTSSNKLATSPIRKPVGGTVKRKPVGGQPSMVTHKQSNEDIESSESLPFSPDSYSNIGNAGHSSSVTTINQSISRSQLPSILLPPEKNSDETLSFGTYAPEPIPRKKEKPLPPSGVDPGIVGYNGDGQWDISKRLNAGYGESLYNKISPNRSKKTAKPPRLPPKIPNGMTREEYMVAEPPKPRDPFVYRDYV